MTNPNQTPNVNDTLAQLYPDDFHAALRAQGVGEENATEIERDLAAGFVLKQHAGELFNHAHNKALSTSGLGIDAEGPHRKWAERAAKAGIGPAEVFDFVSRAYDADPADALKMFQKELERAAKAEEMDKRDYGSPF